MEPTQFTVIAELTALKGFEDEILELVRNQVTLSRKQEDVIYYSSSEVIGEKGKYVFFEVYRTKEAFEINKASSHTQAFFKATNGKLKGDGVKATFLVEINL